MTGLTTIWHDARVRYRANLITIFLIIFTLLGHSNRVSSATLQLNSAQQEWIMAHPRISYAPEADYGPFIYVEKSGQLAGLSLDFLNRIHEKTGLEFHATAADSLHVNLEKAKLAQVDMITSLRPNPERAAYLSFSSPYISVPAALIVRADRSSLQSLHQMNGMRVGVGKGYAVEGYVRDRFPKVIWINFASDDKAMQQLQKKQIDAVVADIASAQFVMKEHQWNDILVGESVGFEYPLSFAYRKDWPELGELIEKGLQAISAGERNAILAKWLPQSNQRSNQNYYPMILAGLLAAVSILLAIFVRRRRRV
jgi:ABC-type amino acid transport substrate-binding protein